MNRNLRCFFIGLCLLCHFSSLPCRAEPSTGYIETVEYGVNEQKEAIGQKRTQRLWFQGPNVRIETLIGDELSHVSVGGENSWAAAPAAGRLLFANQPRAADVPLVTYPEQIRRSFARTFGKKERVGQEEIKGLPCWKYAWREDEFILGDIKMAAQDVSYCVYADERFPFALTRTSTLGGRQDLVEMRLNIPVAAELFLQPQNLKAVRAFQLPKGKFVIEFQEERESKQYGWKVQSSDVFQSDGDKITRTYKQTTTQQNGQVSPFEPMPETLTYQQAEAAIANRLHCPDWMTVKKIGTEPKLDFPADVLQNIVEGLPDEKLWITDHPLLGTITLWRITDAPSDISKRGIARLEIAP